VDYTIVQTGEVYRIDSTNVLFTAKILNKNESITEYGFKWDSVNIYKNAKYTESLTGTPDGDYFESKISSSMVTGIEYFVHAYIKTKKTTAYGKNVSFIAQGSESIQVTGVTPDTITWEDTLTITGKNLGYNKNDVSVTSGSFKFPIISASDDKLIVTTPSNYSLATSPLKIAVLKSAVVIKNLILAPPEIYSFSPDTAGFNSTVILKGKYFHPSKNTSLKINNTTVNTQTVTSNSITFKFPKSMPAGNSLFIVTVFGQTTASTGKFYNSAPLFKSIMPTSGKSGTSISIKGKFFVNGSTTLIVDGATIPIQSINDTTLMFIMPNNIQGGLIDLQVIVDNKSVTALQKFDRLAPVITVFSPDTATYGDTITIHGDRFSEISSENIVKFGTFNAEVVSASKQILKVKTPLISKISNCKLYVTVGAETSTNGNSFFLKPPVITGFSPMNATFNDTITIYAKNLYPALNNISITLGSITQNPVEINSNRIKVLVSPGFKATNGKSIITLKSDILSCVSSDMFQLNMPVIDSISPYSCQFGDTIILYGKYLNPELDYSAIKINETVSLLSASSNKITFTIPNAVNGIHNLIYTTGGMTVTGNNVLQINNPFVSIPVIIRDYFQSLRKGSFSFSIGDKLFICGGFNGATTYQEIMEFNTTSNTWNSLPSIRTGLDPTGFSIGSKGYCLDGHTLYEFDPESLLWTTKKDFPGNAIKFRSVFIINNKAYIATGLDINSNPTDELWEYEPGMDSWTQKSNYPGGPMTYGIGFAMAGQGYVGFGTPGQQYIWQYDPNSDTWSEKCKVPSLVKNISDDRVSPVCFTVNNKAYIGTGYSLQPSSDFYNDMYEFTPGTNYWKKIPDLPLPFGIAWGQAFSIGSRGYIYGGYNTKSVLGNRNDFLWMMDSELLK
jgi:N-acetylneuraminic acid mutarotase